MWVLWATLGTALYLLVSIEATYVIAKTMQKAGERG